MKNGVEVSGDDEFVKKERGCEEKARIWEMSVLIVVNG